MLNLWNRNPVAVEIAQRELNSICHAVGKLRVADTDELHALPMKVTLGIDKDNPDRNVPKAYKPAAGAPPSSPDAGGTAKPRGPWA